MFAAALSSALMLAPQSGCAEVATVYFKADAIVPDRIGRELIEHVAIAVHQGPAAVVVRITGHDDVEAPNAGAAGTSLIRARVVGELLTEGGVSAERIRTVGMGAQARSSTQTRDPLDRRVVIETCPIA